MREGRCIFCATGVDPGPRFCLPTAADAFPSAGSGYSEVWWLGLKRMCALLYLFQIVQEYKSSHPFPLF